MRAFLYLPCLAALVALPTLAGCGRTMTEDDCRAVAERMQEIWQAEAKKASSPNALGGEKAAAVIKTEGEKLVADWSAECKKELQGRRIDPNELDCLLHAENADAIGKCAEH